MPTKINDHQPPRGLLRWLLRLPNGLFRAHLGWLLAGHFLDITHIGRVSGRTRHAVVEVLRHDRASGTYDVVAAFGPRTDWLRNIEHTPRVEISVGLRHFAATASVLDPDAAAAAMLDYTRRFPFARRIIPRLLGYRVDGSDADYEALMRQATVVAFRPLAAASVERAGTARTSAASH